MRRLLIGLCLVLVFSLGVGVSAQGPGTLTYGSMQTGSISAEAPFAFYTFTGAAGDLISASVLGLDAGMIPTLLMLNPAQQQVGAGMPDPLDPARSVLSARLQEAGTYTLLVGGTPGGYVVRLAGIPAGEYPAVNPGAPTTATFEPGGTAQTFIVNTDGTNPVALQIAGADGSGYVATVYSGDGSILTVLTNGTPTACVTLPGSDQPYTLVVTPSGPDASAEVALAVSNTPCPGPQVGGGQGATGGTAGEPPAPASTPEVNGETEQATQETTGGACTVSSGNNVNVRSGPGTEYGVIATLLAGNTLNVTGQTNSGWYRVTGPNLPEGWIAASVVSANGDCGSVPVVEGPATTGEQQVQPPAETPEVNAPAETPEPVADQVAPTPTEAGVQQQGGPTPTATSTTAGPTATYTPSYTPTTPPAPPTAPPDSNYALQIPLDSTVSVTDFVSYPGGDQEDRVSYGVTGMNASVALPGGRATLTLAVSCFGTGTQNVTFFTNGQSYGCGQTILSREVTFDSNTGSVTITAVAGEGTYVQWVLTGTATRIN